MYIGRSLRYNEIVRICAMESYRLSGGITPLLHKLGCGGWSDCLPWPLYGSRNSSGFGWHGGCVCAGAGLDVLEKVWFSWFLQDLNPRTSRAYPGYCTDHAAPYWSEGKRKVLINQLRGEVGIGCVWFMNLWNASLNMVISLKSVKGNFL